MELVIDDFVGLEGQQFDHSLKRIFCAAVPDYSEHIVAVDLHHYRRSWKYVQLMEVQENPEVCPKDMYY